MNILPLEDFSKPLVSDQIEQVRRLKCLSRHSEAQMKRPKLFIVANRLPVTLTNVDSAWDCKRSSGGLVSGLLGVKGIDMIWVGWPGTVVPDDQKDNVSAILREHMCVPVFLTQREIELYYNGYANNVLWPLFHYISPPDHAESTEQWLGYESANLKFVKALVDQSPSDMSFSSGDLIWVHDYHLMLAPRLFRVSLPTAQIGWFLHTPFPSAEVYRALPQRTQLLEGILGADILGFHVHDYVRHFLSSVAQLVSTPVSPYGVGKVKCFAFPIGIDPSEFTGYDSSDDSKENLDIQATGSSTESLKSQPPKSEVSELVESYRAQFGERKVVLGVDRLDYMKGIPEKLEIFSKFLELHPEWLGRVVLVQLAVPSRGDVAEYQRLKQKVHSLVGQICGKYQRLTNGPPVIYLDSAINHEELVALYRAADVALITSLRDGMNLVSYEFIAANKTGVLVLSEFAGAAQTLGSGCLKINPWDLDESAEQINAALTLTIKEKRCLRESAWNFVSTHTSQKWAEDFVSSLRLCASERPDRRSLPFPTDDCVRQFDEHSTRKLILIDLIECLIPSKGRNGIPVTLYPEMIRCHSGLKRILQRLSSRTDCEVFIFTAHSAVLLESFLDGIERISLIAENGTVISIRAQNGQKLEFSLIEFLNKLPTPKSPGMNQRLASPKAADLGPFSGMIVPREWLAIKSKVREIMEFFSDRSPGTYVEETDFSIKWLFDNTQDGSSMNKELSVHLCAGPLLNGEAFLNTTSRFVEVRPHGVSLAPVLRRLLSGGLSGDYDTCLLVSADHQLVGEVAEVFSGRTIFPASVGEGAQFALHSPSHLEAVLSRLASI